LRKNCESLGSLRSLGMTVGTELRSLIEKLDKFAISELRSVL